MPCPTCHSALIDTIGRTKRCAHCGHTWRGRSRSSRPAAIPYLVVTCPHCHSEDTEIYRTARPRRYHRCRACSRTFVSVEISTLQESSP